MKNYPEIGVAKRDDTLLLKTILKVERDGVWYDVHIDGMWSKMSIDEAKMRMEEQVKLIYLFYEVHEQSVVSESQESVSYPNLDNTDKSYYNNLLGKFK